MGPEDEDSPDIARPGQWVLSKHIADPVWCWRVVNRQSGDWHGFGLTVADAMQLCRRLEQYDALQEALKALEDEIKRQTDFARAVEGTTLARWVTEIVARQMGS